MTKLGLIVMLRPLVTLTIPPFPPSCPLRALTVIPPEALLTRRVSLLGLLARLGTGPVILTVMVPPFPVSVPPEVAPLAESNKDPPPPPVTFSAAAVIEITPPLFGFGLSAPAALAPPNPRAPVGVLNTRGPASIVMLPPDPFVRGATFMTIGLSSVTPRPTSSTVPPSPDINPPQARTGWDSRNRELSDVKVIFPPAPVPPEVALIVPL